MPTEVCLDPNIAEGEECTNFKLVVPPDSEIVQRRNKVLDLMKTRSTLTGSKHTPAEYEVAKEEPVELVAAGRRPMEGAPLRVAGARARSARCSAPTARSTALRWTTAATRSSPRST